MSAGVLSRNHNFFAGKFFFTERSYIISQFVTHIIHGKGCVGRKSGRHLIEEAAINHMSAHISGKGGTVHITIVLAKVPLADPRCDQIIDFCSPIQKHGVVMSVFCTLDGGTIFIMSREDHDLCI